MMTIIDGKKLSTKIQDEIKNEVVELEKRGVIPGLAVLLIGDDPASHTYVKMKEKACERVGFYSVVHKMPDTISQDEIIETIKMMNTNPKN